MNEQKPQQTAFATPQDLYQTDDWRPGYFFSPAARLPRLARNWPQLKDVGADVLDGWRFSDNPESDWYLKNVALRDPSARDPITGERARIKAGPKLREEAERYRAAIEGDLYYRMRHIECLELKPDNQQMQPPAIEGEAFCTQPGDILIRRVGNVTASLVTEYHRQHPVDANVGIIRGLPQREAVWVTFCLNQQLYKEYLEQQFGTTSLVRVGLKRIRSVPTPPVPTNFARLADQFLKHYNAKTEGEDRLFQLRQRVRRHIQPKLPKNEQEFGSFDFYSPRDITDVLSHASASQARSSREMLDTGEFTHLGELANIADHGTKQTKPKQRPENPRVLRIGDIDAQLGIDASAATTNHTWRHHERPLSKFDVLISTFVSSPRVGLVAQDMPEPIFPTEQLAVLNFNQYPGAYALVMEHPSIQRQLEQLATGTVQRFIHSRKFKQLVLPIIERQTAMFWHQQLADILNDQSQQRAQIRTVLNEMLQIYEKAHSGNDSHKREHAA